jgi:hypothetical protein
MGLLNPRILHLIADQSTGQNAGGAQAQQSDTDEDSELCRNWKVVQRFHGVLRWLKAASCAMASNRDNTHVLLRSFLTSGASGPQQSQRSNFYIGRDIVAGPS